MKHDCTRRHHSLGTEVLRSLRQVASAPRKGSQRLLRRMPRDVARSRGERKEGSMSLVLDWLSAAADRDPPPIPLASYRGRTKSLLRRYFRKSLEVGRVPSIIGREFFRAQTS